MTSNVIKTHRYLYVDLFWQRASVRSNTDHSNKANTHAGNCVVLSCFIWHIAIFKRKESANPKWIELGRIEGKKTKHGSAKLNFWEVFHQNCSTLPHRYLWINLCYRGTQLGISATGRLLWYTVLKWRLIMRSQITGTAERCRKSDSKSEYLPLPDVFRDNEKAGRMLSHLANTFDSGWLIDCFARGGRRKIPACQDNISCDVYLLLFVLDCYNDYCACGLLLLVLDLNTYRSPYTTIILVW